MKIILVHSNRPYFCNEPCCVCLGMFDGVHRGHQELLAQTARIAKEKKLRSGAVTFLAQREKNSIDTLEQQLCKLGAEMDFVFVFVFDEAFRKQTAEAFIAGELKGKLQVQHIVCGEDFRFGYQRQGSVDTLRSFSAQYGYALSVVPPVTEAGMVISSTLIRQKLKQGNIREANHLLGRPYAFTGIVRKGNQIGRTLQLPTLNIPLERGLVELPNGVYASKALVDGIWYQSITNIGTAPTFQEKSKVSETFLQNFDRDVYNKPVTVELYQFLREEQKFSNPEELVKAIKEDIKKCVQYY